MVSVTKDPIELVFSGVTAARGTILYAVETDGDLLEIFDPSTYVATPLRPEEEYGLASISTNGSAYAVVGGDLYFAFPVVYYPKSGPDTSKAQSFDLQIARLTQGGELEMVHLYRFGSYAIQYGINEEMETYATAFEGKYVLGIDDDPFDDLGLPEQLVSFDPSGLPFQISSFTRTFAQVDTDMAVMGDTVFDFGNGDTLTVTRVTDTADLETWLGWF